MLVGYLSKLQSSKNLESQLQLSAHWCNCTTYSSSHHYIYQCDYYFQVCYQGKCCCLHVESYYDCFDLVKSYHLGDGICMSLYYNIVFFRNYFTITLMGFCVEHQSINQLFCFYLKCGVSNLKYKRNYNLFTLSYFQISRLLTV